MSYLTKLPHDPLLDLDPWIGQRSASFRFALTNGTTGEHLGDIHPIRGASLTHDTTRTIKRQLSLSLGAADTAAINPISDRINLYMTFPNGREEPLGRYMFTDMSSTKFTSGNLAQISMNDEMFLVDQELLVGINGVGLDVNSVVAKVLSGLPVTFTAESSPYTANEAWAIGTTRGQILETLSVTGDWFSPWFDNNGIMRFIRTFNPAMAIPDFDFDTGNKVNRSGITKTNDLLTAPNTIIVVSNAPGEGASNTPLVGIATLPPNAPNSIPNRGFSIAQTFNLQLSTQSQAEATARGLMQRQTIFERVQLTTAPDPRHDSYNVIRWDGANWLELGWSMALTAGGAMNHLLRKGVAKMTAPDQAAPDLISIGAQSIVENAKRLGLTWTLTLATVFSSDPLTAIVDGDTEPIGMTSMIGSPGVDQHVYVIQIPPSGNFIVGQTGRGLGPIGDAYWHNNGVVAASTGLEVAVASASWDNEPALEFASGRMFRAVLTCLNIQTGAAGSLQDIRIRKGAASTSGTLFARFQVPSPGGSNGTSQTLIGYIKNTSSANVITQLSVTNTRTLGAGTASLYGDTEYRMIMTVEDIGAVSDMPSLASNTNSV